MFRPNSLNARLILLVSFILLTTGILSGWLTARRHYAAHQGIMHRNALVMTRNFGDRCGYFLVLQDYAGLESYLRKSIESSDLVRLTVCEPDGGVVSDIQPPSAPPLLSEKAAAHLTPPHLRQTAVHTDQEEMIIWQPIEAGTLIGWLKAVYSLAEIKKMETETWRNSILLSLLWVAASTTLLLLMLRPMVRDIGRLAHFAQGLNARDGTQIPVPTGPLEMKNLGGALNDASARIFATEQELDHERKALKKQYSTLRGILDSTTALIFSVDRDYRYTSFNTAHAAVMQAIYGAEIQPGGCLLDFMTVPEDREKAKQNLDRALTGERFVEAAFSGEDTLSRLYFEVSHNPILAEDGSVIGVAVMSQDMTERSRIEEALRKSEENYRRLLDTIQEGIWVIDQEATTTFVNPRMARILGYPPEEILGRPLFSFMDQEGRKIAQRNILRRQQGISEQHDFEFIRKDGSRIATRLETGPIVDENGQYLGSIAAVADITESRQAQEEIMKLNRELEQRVMERTTELVAKNEELERTMKLFVGRELRMIELKQKLAELENNS